MEIKTTTNEYGWQKVDCPFCGKECSATSGCSKDSQNRTPKGLLKHIANQSKAEALEIAMGEMVLGDAKHLQFYQKHATGQKAIVTTAKRSFPIDCIKII